jgi:hypothetical protein
VNQNVAECKVHDIWRRKIMRILIDFCSSIWGYHTDYCDIIFWAVIPCTPQRTSPKPRKYVYRRHLLMSSSKPGEQYVLCFLSIRIVEGGVQTGSTRHVIHFWPIVTAPGYCEDGEFSGMKTGRGNRSTWRKLPQRHFVHHKSHLTRPGREPGSPRWEASD